MCGDREKVDKREDQKKRYVTRKRTKKKEDRTETKMIISQIKSKRSNGVEKTWKRHTHTHRFNVWNQTFTDGDAGKTAVSMFFPVRL